MTRVTSGGHYNDHTLASMQAVVTFLPNRTMKVSLALSILVLFVRSCLAFLPTSSCTAGCINLYGASDFKAKKWFLRETTSISSVTPFSQLKMTKKDCEKNVNSNLVVDADPFTLTVIGFGLIAFNFLVLANMGDVGLAGVVARVINSFSDKTY